MGFSGLEQRNRNWALVRNKYQLDLVARPLSVYQTMLEFWLAVGGRADAFRFFDATDFSFSITAVTPSLGDGVNTVFQLQKIYTVGAGPNARAYTRTISKPIMSHQSTTVGSSINYNGSAVITDFQGNSLPDTVVMFDNGVSAPNLNPYTIDATTGLVTFNTPPVNGHAITSTGQFHVPVRFDSDDWPAQIVESNIQSGGTLVAVTGIQLVEVKIIPGQSQG